MIKISKIIACLLASGVVCGAYAAAPSAHINSSLNRSMLFPLDPRFILWGGSGDFTYSRGDLMAPLIGSQNSIVYADLQGKYGHDHTWFGAFGLGIRQIVQYQTILGAYVFGDRSESPSDHSYWDVSPGVEVMTNEWDAHVNGYFPTGEKQNLDGMYYGDQLGIASGVTFRGHTEYSILFKKYESVGSGVDGELGFTIPHSHRIRVYVGGYYFDPKRASGIHGGLAGIQIPMSQYLAFQVEDSYDNDNHNTILVSLRLWLGGPDKTGAPDIHDRLLDPIPRNLASFATGMAIPARASIINTGQTRVERRNVWFFSPSGAPFNPALGANQGTYNNPLHGSSFTQSTVNAINGFTPNASFFFSPGGYAMNAPTGNGFQFSNETNRVELMNGQSLFGRTGNYELPASSANRPLFLGGLALQGNNTVDDIDLTGHGTNETIGIYADRANNVFIHNVGVSDYHGASGSNENAAEGIDLENSDNVQLNKVVVSDIAGSNGVAGVAAGDNGSDGGNAIGIHLKNDTSVLMQKITVNDIQGGVGGNGANGVGGAVGQSGSGSGDNGDAGGQGGRGGNGGRGGLAQGISIQNSQHVVLSDALIENLVAGNGGDGGVGGQGGAGGNGGGGSLNASLTQAVAVSVASNGGNGGKGGAGGQGGIGGKAQALSAAGSDLALSHAIMGGVRDGIGGLGAEGGQGGAGGQGQNGGQNGTAGDDGDIGLSGLGGV